MRINYKGFFNGNGGYNVLARGLSSLMNHAGIDVRIEELSGQPVQNLLGLQQKTAENRKQLVHQLPAQYPGADIYYTVTEYNELPYGCVSPMRRAEMLLTQTEFCKKIFEEQTGVPTHVIGYPLDTQFKPKGLKYKFHPPIDQFKFKFVSVFEWTQRKDPYMLIKAFTEEFGKDEDVCLILKTWSVQENPRKWIGILGQHHNIFWMPQMMPHLAPLYRACDCYVTSTQGEGFGHTVAEAMACGTRVIAPKSSGILEYANRSNCLLCDVEEKKVKETASYKFAGIERHGLIKPWFTCWEPKIEHLKKLMRKAFRSELKFLRQNALKIHEQFSYDNIVKQIKEAFEIG